MRTKFPAILFFLFLFGMGVLEAYLPDTDISAAERRHLAKAPALSTDTLLSGDYMTDMETYLLDQFPGRNLFRCMKANFDLKLLQKEDTDGYYLIENSIYKRPAPIKENNILLCADYFDRIMRTYFPDTRGHYIVIPEKSYYAALSSKNPTLADRDILSTQEKALSLPEAPTLTSIDLYSQLSVSDFYRTDSHWRQECLPHAAQYILDGLLKDQEGYIRENASPYREVLLSDAFYGGLSAASGLKPAPDKLITLTNERTESAVVYDYETKKNFSVYQPEKLSSPDPYDIYLGGAKALLEIRVPHPQSGRELVLFRDSFGSSIAPLLLEEYDVIYVVDLRYITVSNAMQYISPAPDCDVLFLYSTATLSGGGIRLESLDG
ncbi:hypothetical protein D7X98_09690 [bacterium 1XD8-76]|nr:hypothetical protein D7X98_09690 [bacterium 1XD8-76]